MNANIEVTGRKRVDKPLQQRALGYIETVMATMHKELRGTTQIAHLIHLRGRIEYLQLRAAAKILFDQFAILRCTIVENGETFHFRETLSFDRIPMRQISIGDTNSWRVFLDGEVDDALIQTEALWRLTLISSSIVDETGLVIVGHHAIADWTGLEVLFTQLLSIIDRTISGEQMEVTHRDIHPPVDSYLRHSREVASASASAPRGQIKFVRSAPLASRKTRGLSSMLDPAQYAKLQRRCAFEKVKLHSLLGAALSLSAYTVGLIESPVPVWTPVSLRVFGELRRKSEADLSCYISVADTPVDIASGDIWSIARQYEIDLFRYTRQCCLRYKEIDTMVLMAQIQAIRDSQVFLQGFSITNVGDTLLPVCRNFAILDYVTRVNRLAGNFATSVQVDVFKQNLRFTFIYQEPLWDAHTVTTLCGSFMDQLKSLCTQGAMP
ncbi:MAG: hypothetical protein ACYC5H_13745 [Methylovirgula sp.]